MTSVLITGVSGFCGRHLVRRLREERDYRIVGLDVLCDSLSEKDLNDYVNVDMRQSAPLQSVIMRERPMWVFHLAGVASGLPAKIYETNLLSVINLLEALCQNSPETRVLIVGSAAEYGHVPESKMPIRESQPCKPTGAYGLSKYAATLAALNYSQRRALNVVVARPFNIVGPGVSSSLVVGAIIHRILESIGRRRRSIVTAGNLDTERDFIAVDDVVRAYIQLMKSNVSGKIFNICSGVPTSIRSIVEKLISFSPTPIRVSFDPALARKDEAITVYGSSRRIYQKIGFKPSVSLDSALFQAWEYEYNRKERVSRDHQ